MFEFVHFGHPGIDCAFRNPPRITLGSLMYNHSGGYWTGQRSNCQTWSSTQRDHL